MNTLKFKEYLEKIVGEIGFVSDFQIVDETKDAIKVRLNITKLCFIQIYLNFKKGIKNYVVVLSGQRIFGLDCDGGNWHCHPWKNPDKHVPAKEIPLKEFLFETYKGLVDQQLL